MGQRNSQALGEAFIEFYLLLCEVVPAFALQLQEPNILATHQKGDPDKSPVIPTKVAPLPTRFSVRREKRDGGGYNFKRKRFLGMSLSLTAEVFTMFIYP
jgi:hypothetical protein